MHVTLGQLTARPRDLARPSCNSAPVRCRVKLASARVANYAVAAADMQVNQTVREGDTETALVQLQVGVQHGTAQHACPPYI